MTTKDIYTYYICHDCIGDRFLTKVVRAEGIRVACSYCNAVGEALPLDDLAQRIHEVLQDHFELTSNQPTGYEYMLAEEGWWERPGYPVANVIADIAEVSEEIATDVMELLSDHYGYLAIKDGEENPYSSDACYEEQGADDSAWKTFCDQIRSHGRFFNRYAEDELTHIFGDLGTQKTFRSKSVIREISPDSQSGYIWRSRIAQSPKELEVILKSPAREIGPPPPRLAKGGRMNALGIPVFYGAMEKDTCVAELRAPVGSQVVVAKFNLLRPVRLLDLDALTEIWNIDASHFDPDYYKHEGRVASLRTLAQEICRPVMPQEKAFEYLPSQAVAEYLANKLDLRLDGIIFRSSQTGCGRNVVLFNQACGVEPDDLPEGTEVEVYIPYDKYGEDHDEDDDSYIRHISVFETVPPTPATSPHNGDATFLDAYLSLPRWDEDEELPTYSEPTLRIDMKSIFVLDIKSVQYEYHYLKVSRHRRVKSEGV